MRADPVRKLIMTRASSRKFESACSNARSNIMRLTLGAEEAAATDNMPRAKLSPRRRLRSLAILHAIAIMTPPSRRELTLFEKSNRAQTNRGLALVSS